MVTVNLPVCKAFCLFKYEVSRVCAPVCLRLHRDGNEVAVIICHKMAFHKSTTHPQLNNRLLIIFRDKHKYVQNIPQIHKIALDSSTIHFLLSMLNNRLFIIYSHLQMHVAPCDKCKCTLHCVTNATAHRVVLCHKCNCISA